MRCILACTLVVITAAPPVSLAAQAPPPVADVLRAQTSSQGLMTWSPTELLTWQDFRGPERVVTDEAAQNLSGVAFYVQCRDSVLAFAAVATFDPQVSWVRSDVLKDSVASRRSFQHEQTHFNIAEVLARRVRRAFDAIAGACPGHEARAGEVFQEIITEGQGLNERYDDETAHGMRPRSQRDWDRHILSLLDSLSPYAAPFGRE